MSDVGTFRTTILIESVERRGETRAVENALVATGSEFTWVPRPVLEELGIRPERRCTAQAARNRGTYSRRGRKRATLGAMS